MLGSKTITIPAPPTVDIEALHDDLTCSAAGPCGTVLLHYNPENSLSAVVYLEVGATPVWSINAPVSFDSFLQSLPLRGVQCDQEVFGTWARRCRAHAGANEH